MRARTAGYAGRKFFDFLRLLKRHRITVVVDVRRWPTSRYWPAFKRERLERSLPRHNIKYIWLGQQLGGFRGGYERWMTTKEFKSGLRLLLETARTESLLLLCRERNWRGCHRRYIARALRKSGLTVVNLD